MSVRQRRARRETRISAGLLWIGYGAYLVFDAIAATRRWATSGNQPTGLVTDIAQAFVGQAGAVVLEVLVGLAFAVVGVRDIRRALRPRL